MYNLSKKPIKYLFLLIIACTFTWIITSCNTQKRGTEKPIDTLAYTPQKYEKHSATCVREDSLCATVRFQYPVFQDKDLAPINEQIVKELINIFHDENDKSAQRPNSFDDLSVKFIKDYDDLIKANKSEAQQATDPMMAIPWTMEGTSRVIRQTKELLVIHTNSNWYTGGAHPISMEYYHNYDLKTHKKLSLDDVCEKDYAQKLLAVAEKQFRKNEHLADTTKLDDASGYFFENGKFLLNDNFMLTENGLLFLWNVYEIKSYAEGVTTLEIPFEDLKGILRKEYF